jgi:hypothetical protein
LDDENVLWRYIDGITCNYSRGAGAAAQPSFKALRIFYNENVHLSHAQCLICGFHTDCADKARALSHHFLIHKKDGFSFDSEVDTAGKLLNAVEGDHLRLRSPSPLLRPPILKTEVKRYIDLGKARVDFAKTFYKCSACNYLAIPATGKQSETKNISNHFHQKKRATSTLNGHDMFLGLCASDGRKKYSQLTYSTHTNENPAYVKLYDGCYVEVADGFQSYFIDCQTLVRILLITSDQYMYDYGDFL